MATDDRVRVDELVQIVLQRRDYWATERTKGQAIQNTDRTALCDAVISEYYTLPDAIAAGSSK
jgi:hypothetical protein